jgi:hypothetical protein
MYTLKEAAVIANTTPYILRYNIRKGHLIVSKQPYENNPERFTYLISLSDLEDWQRKKNWTAENEGELKFVQKKKKIATSKKTIKKQDITKWEKLGNGEIEEPQYKNSPHVSGVVFLTMKEFDDLEILGVVIKEDVMHWDMIVKTSVPLALEDAKPWRSKDGHKCVLEDWLTIRKEGKKLRYDRIYITTGAWDNKKQKYPTWA